MVHADHVRLIEEGLEFDGGGVWADVGSGEGAFTLALRDILGQNVVIFSIDKDPQSLQAQRRKMEEQFPETVIRYEIADFMGKLNVPRLDGILAANALHFEEDTLGAIKHLKRYLKPVGKLIVVEYNVDTGNRWVPHPFSYETFESLAKKAGARDVNLLSTIHSDFLKEIYAGEAVF